MKPGRGRMPRTVQAALVLSLLALCVAVYAVLGSWQAHKALAALPPSGGDDAIGGFVDGYYIRSLVMSAALAFLFGVPGLLMIATILWRHPFLTLASAILFPVFFLLALVAVIMFRGADIAVIGKIAILVWGLPCALLLTSTSRDYLE